VAVLRGRDELNLPHKICRRGPIVTAKVIEPITEFLPRRIAQREYTIAKWKSAVNSEKSALQRVPACEA
jgi:hypothetical protein